MHLQWLGEQMTANRHTLQCRWYSSLGTLVSANSHKMHNYKLYYCTKLPNEIIRTSMVFLWAFSQLICSLLYIHVTSSPPYYASTFYTTCTRLPISVYCVCIVYMHAHARAHVCVCVCVHILYIIFYM